MMWLTRMNLRGPKYPTVANRLLWIKVAAQAVGAGRAPWPSFVSLNSRKRDLPCFLSISHKCIVLFVCFCRKKYEQMPDLIISLSHTLWSEHYIVILPDTHIPSVFLPLIQSCVNFILLLFSLAIRTAGVGQGWGRGSPPSWQHIHGNIWGWD